MVTVIVGLGVLVLMALPITWRRAVLIGLMVAGFVLVLSIDRTRTFFALAVPHGVLAGTLVAGAAGLAALGGWWVLGARRGSSEPPPAA
jgi:hypothetical protein